MAEGPGAAPAAPPATAGTTLRHYGELLRRNLWLCIGLTLAAAALAALLAVYKLNASPVYVASAKVTVQPTDAELRFTQVYVRSSSYDSANVVTQSHMEYLRSREIAERTYRLLTERSAAEGAEALPEEDSALKEFLSAAKRSVKSTLRWMNSGSFVPVTGEASVINDIQEAISINMIESSFIMEISVAWKDPETAAEIANILAQVYQERTREQSAAASEELMDFLRAQRAEVEAEIARLTLNRNQFRNANGIVDFGAERADLLSRLSQEQARLDADRASLRATRAILTSFEQGDRRLRRDGLDQAAEDELQLARLREVELVEALDERQQIIAGLETRLREFAAFESPIESIDNAMAREETRLNDIDSRLLTVLMNESEAMETLRLIDPARPPLYPDNPKVLKETVFGGAAGLMLAFFLIFARDQVGSKLRTSADLAEASGLRVLQPVDVSGKRRKTGEGPLLGWPQLESGLPVLVLDSRSEDRAEAVVQEMIARAPEAAAFDIGVLKHARRPGYVPEDTEAVLVTVGRDEADAGVLAEQLADLRRVLNVPMAVTYVDRYRAA
jgi:uncharacterized protein involved in exopolysaccharide biosynthesis